MRFPQFRPALAVVAVLAIVLPASAAPIETSAKQAILVDSTTGTVLFEKNADERMPTSSMSKVMTMYMLFERLKEGRISLDDTLPVSERAWRMQGSKMFVELGNRIPVEDLIRGVVIQSGNDATVVVAEGLSGTEDAFGRAMTERAHAMGMTASNFTNASGWPDPNHYSTARDLATLAERMIEDFPEFYHYYSETEYTYHGIKQGNRNPLLYKGMGADGLKTGHTEGAGYGLIGTVLRNDRRLILVVNGLDSVNARSEEAERLLEWGFREFDSFKLLQAGDVVDHAEIWYGAAANVPLVPEQDVVVTMTRDARQNLSAKVVLQEPVEAPVAKGARIGTLVLSAPDMAKPYEVPLVAAADVDEVGMLGRIGASFMHLVKSQMP